MCLECLADTMNLVNILALDKGDQHQGISTVKHICHQIIYNLYAIDYKLLDQSVGKLDSLTRKTPLRKAIIEHESQQ